VAVLRELPQIEELSLRNTEVSDLGVASLSELTALRSLDLSHTLLADSALLHSRD
jgi:Leucine-rich repeat (LRR) protein